MESGTLETLKTLGQIAGIGGIALGVLLILFRAVIQKNIPGQLPPEKGYRLLVLMLVLVWSVAISGIIAWTYADHRTSNTADNGKPPTPALPSGAAGKPASTDRASANLAGSEPPPYELSIISMQPGEPIVVRVRRKNTGQLEALNVKGFFLVKLFPNSMRTDDACNELGTDLKVLKNAGAISDSTTVPAGDFYQKDVKGPELSLEQIQRVHQDALSVYVAGFYTWSDSQNQNWSWHFRKLVQGSLGDCGGKPWIDW